MAEEISQEQIEEHNQAWAGFTSFVKYGSAGVIVIVLGMYAFLV